jgi:hypothetical protein
MYTGKYFIFLVLLLGAANLAAHGHALNDGLFLDDHWHVLRLAESDWSLSAFFNATTIAPDRFMHMWWQEKAISWWYIRPFAMFLSKIVYHCSGGSVKSLHALSILLHLLNALMVHHLVLRMTRRRFWAIVAALLLIVYSHSVYAVAWLAAQNALLQTALTLGALILYARASGLDLYAGPSDDTARSERPIPPLRVLPAAGVFVLWILGLLSRESAVMLPVFVVAFDLAFGGRRQVRARLGTYAVMAFTAVLFLGWRLIFFDHPMPDFYVQRPRGIGYAGWWMAKLMHYMTSTVWLSPMSIGPSGRFSPWTDLPGDGVLMILILGVMGVGYHMSARGVRGFWIWPLWILLGLLPVVPIVATPHNGYLPSVGFAIAMAIGPALRHETRPTSVGRWCPGVTIWFLIATTIYMPIYRPMWYSVMAAERMTIAQVMDMPPPAGARDLFFINLPFVNIYARYHIDEALGRGARLGVARQDEPAYRTHVLTYAPDLLRMEQGCRLEQVDAWRFRVRIEGSRPWFSGALGRFLIEATRAEGRFRPGDVIRGDLFETRIVAADDLGVSELEFRFREPLASRRFCFYVGTPDCSAARVRFAGESELAAPGVTPPSALGKPLAMQEIRAAAVRLQAGEPAAAATLFAGVRSPDLPVRREAARVIDAVCRPVAAALAAPVLRGRPGSPTPWAPWDEVAAWWSRHVDGPALRVLPSAHERYEALRWQRDALFRIRGIASKIIRSDLYLTGPPFPGPR